ncbi:DNA-binding transcriptional regulator, MarR family [Sinosporangium album]|uniref:DNA-binding transcriptional regulator, MarR family n=1 Tax=Sinosporangium album TaxID=504805 RepID=A0A1G7TBX1_9ACTN|nr:MarR family transcriptional regulator [Sinosporangium album]SDG32806.1 DNA-binding transcriptional regulator, MarR family [Sinosporangium album]
MNNDRSCSLPAGLETDVGWLLGQTFHAYNTTTQRVMAEFPAAHRGYMLVSAAVHESARNQIEMARQLGVDRSVMVNLVDELEREGLVERRPDPTDRRNRLIAATEQGRERLACSLAAIRRAEEELLAPLEEHEKRAFREMLRRIVARGVPEEARHAACAAAETGDDRLVGTDRHR